MWLIKHNEESIFNESAPNNMTLVWFSFRLFFCHTKCNWTKKTPKFSQCPICGSTDPLEVDWFSRIPSTRILEPSTHSGLSFPSLTWKLKMKVSKAGISIFQGVHPFFRFHIKFWEGSCSIRSNISWWCHFLSWISTKTCFMFREVANLDVPGRKLGSMVIGSMG